MQATTQSDLRQFREFLIQQADRDSVDLTPEDLLDQWRANHPLPVELEASAVEIQQTLDDMLPNAGVPARDASDEIRRSFGFRARS